MLITSLKYLQSNMKTGVWPKTGHCRLAILTCKIHHHKMEAKEPGKVWLKTGESAPPMQMGSEEDGCWREWTGSSHQMASISLWSGDDLPGWEKEIQDLKIIDDICKIHWSEREDELPSEIEWKCCAELWAGYHNLRSSAISLINTHCLAIKIISLQVFAQ